jgi:hypothetical protein
MIKFYNFRPWSGENDKRKAKKVKCAGAGCGSRTHSAKSRKILKLRFPSTRRITISANRTWRNEIEDEQTNNGHSLDTFAGCAYYCHSRWTVRASSSGVCESPSWRSVYLPHAYFFLHQYFFTTAKAKEINTISS